MRINPAEHNLCAAVLLRALQDIWDYRIREKNGSYEGKGTNPDKRRIEDRRHYNSAVRWVSRMSEDYVLDFRSICGLLNLDANSVKRVIIEGPNNDYETKKSFLEQEI